MVVSGYFFEGIFPLSHGFGPHSRPLRNREKILRQICLLPTSSYAILPSSVGCVSWMCWFIADRAIGRIDWLVPRRVSRLIAFGWNAQAGLLRFLRRFNVFIEQFLGLGLMVP
jgi:hypothetical protein